MNRTRLLLANDHALVRAGIRALVDKIPDIEVVGDASNGREVLELVRSKRIPNGQQQAMPIPVWVPQEFSDWQPDAEEYYVATTQARKHLISVRCALE